MSSGSECHDLKIRTSSSCGLALVLRFDRAAHHLVDSNNYTFSGLSALVARVVQPDAAGLTAERLAALAEAYPRR